MCGEANGELSLEKQGACVDEAVACSKHRLFAPFSLHFFLVGVTRCSHFDLRNGSKLAPCIIVSPPIVSFPPGDI